MFLIFSFVTFPEHSVSALLSCFQFMSDYNTKLFELKMLRWEENTTQSHIKTTIGDN